MPIIDGQEYTLLKDYDKGKYCGLTFPGKVTYLRNRVDFILLHPCKLAMVDAMNGQGLILTTAICAGISAASTFLKGMRAPSGSDKEFFMAFVKKYMDKRLQQQISILRITWADWLYKDLRCGLSHDFTIHRGGIEENPQYIVEHKAYGPEICPSQLLADFARGWSKYLDDVKHDGPTKNLGLLFQKRFDNVFHD
jgi:hypothetical protein